MTYIEKLEKQIEDVEPIIDKMLDNSSIYYHDPYKGSSIIKIGERNVYHWSKKDERNQIKVKEKYLKFYQNFKLLLDKAQPNTLKKIQQSNKSIINLIEQNKAPASTKEGKQLFRNQTKVFKDFLNLLTNEDKRTLILPDTNSLIQVPEPKS